MEKFTCTLTVSQWTCDFAADLRVRTCNHQASSTSSAVSQVIFFCGPKAQLISKVYDPIYGGLSIQIALWAMIWYLLLFFIEKESEGHQKKMKAGERLLQTFERNVNYPVGWNGSVVARRGKEEIIKIPAHTDATVLSKSKTCIYKANECTFSCRRTSLIKLLNVGQLVFNHAVL